MLESDVPLQKSRCAGESVETEPTWNLEPICKPCQRYVDIIVFATSAANEPANPLDALSGNVEVTPRTRHGENLVEGAAVSPQSPIYQGAIE